MAKQEVLDRVREDLSRGHTHLAIQRLRGLLATDPADQDIRLALARAYRQAGNLVEAGRWAYLTDDLRPDEAEAFTRAHPSPWLRLRVLRLTEDAGALPPPAVLRLRLLTEQARRAGPPPGPARTERDPGRARGNAVPCLFVTATLLVLAVLVLIGVYQAVRWVINY